MGEGHGAQRAGARYRRELLVTFALVVVLFVVELAAGIVTNSLALLSDAGHMLTDAVGIGMSLAAITIANRAAHARHRTFGFYRIEIVAALLNALLLFAVAGYVLVEAARRFQAPPEVLTTPMLIVGVGGLAVNVAGLWLLRAGSRESINVEGAFMGGGQYHRSRPPIAVRPQPIQRGDTPAVTGHQAREPIGRHRRGQVIADRALVFEELGRDHGANGVQADVLRPGRTAAVAVEAGDGVGAARLQRAAQYVAVGHGRQSRAASLSVRYG